MGIDKQSFKFIAEAKIIASRTVREPKVLFLGKPTVIEDSAFSRDRFIDLFKGWSVKTVDIYKENNCDFTLDICSNTIHERFDLIVDHGTLQHVYSPYDAVKNLYSTLNAGGVILHIVPVAGYENFGYFQFSVDWFKEIYSGTFEKLEIFLINESFPNRFIKVQRDFSKRLVGRWRIVVIVLKGSEMGMPKFAQDEFSQRQNDTVQSSYNKYRARLAFFKTAFFSIFKL